MYRNWRGARRRRWPRSRPVGCLLWVLLILVVLIVIAVAFGGFQKGTQYKGLGRGEAVASQLYVPGGQR